MLLGAAKLAAVQRLFSEGEELWAYVEEASEDLEKIKLSTRVLEREVSMWRSCKLGHLQLACIGVEGLGHLAVTFIG